MVFVCLVVSGTATDYFYVRRKKQQTVANVEISNSNTNNNKRGENAGQVNPSCDELQMEPKGDVKIQLQGASLEEAPVDEPKHSSFNVMQEPYQPGNEQNV